MINGRSWFLKIKSLIPAEESFPVIAKEYATLAYSYVMGTTLGSIATRVASTSYITYGTENMSTAAKTMILHLIRPDAIYRWGSQVIEPDVWLSILEHVGRNNSTFATHVVSSTGTDTYSTISTALSLQALNQKHGGANSMVEAMVQDLSRNGWTMGRIRTRIEKYLHVTS